MIAQLKSTLAIPAIALLIALLMPFSLVNSAESSSTFGNLVVPDAATPKNAEQCVEATEVMRRDHMKFLLQQRDATVIDGIRSGKYSLVGCIDCHNPSVAGEEIVRYEDPEHFCAGCHLYTSVKIDCFECHADRGLETVQQSLLQSDLGDLWASAEWKFDSRLLSAQTLRHRQGGLQGVD
jgi:hypothetical protein